MPFDWDEHVECKTITYCIEEFEPPDTGPCHASRAAMIKEGQRLNADLVAMYREAEQLSSAVSQWVELVEKREAEISLLRKALAWKIQDACSHNFTPFACDRCIDEFLAMVDGI
jgi:hypothetical protein